MLAALLLLQATSGLMITFKEEAGRLLHPRAMKSVAEGPRIDPDRALTRAHTAAGDCTPERLYFPRHKDGVFLLRCRDPAGALRLATVDAVTGQLLKAGSVWAFPFEAADLLHLDLTSGRTGRNVVGTAGLLLLMLAAFGLAAWWPGWARIVRALRIPWRGATRQKLVQLHRSAGAVLSAFLILTAATGAALAFYPVLERALDKWLPVAKAPVFEQTSSDAPLMSFLEVEQRALSHFPQDTVRDIRMVAGSLDVALVVLNPAHSGRPRSADRVWVDRRDGTTVAASVADEPAGSRVLGWMLPVHTGEVLGLFGQWLSFVVGLGLLGLLVTGCASWILHRFSKRSAHRS